MKKIIAFLLVGFMTLAAAPAHAQLGGGGSGGSSGAGPNGELFIIPTVTITDSIIELEPIADNGYSWHTFQDSVDMIPHFPPLSPSIIDSNGEVKMVSRIKLLRMANYNPDDAEYNFAYSNHSFQWNVKADLLTGYNITELSNQGTKTMTSGPMPSWVTNQDFSFFVEQQWVYDTVLDKYIQYGSTTHHIVPKWDNDGTEQHPSFTNDWLLDNPGFEN